MLWGLLVSMHLVGLVGYTLLLRKSALSTINKYALAALMQTAIFLPSLFFLLSSQVKFTLDGNAYLKLATASVLVVALNLAVTKALQLLEASTFSILYNLRLFVTTVLGFIFLSETPKTLQILGGIIIFASVVMLGLHKNKKYKSRPVLYGLVAMLLLSFLATLEKNIVLTIGFPTYIFIVGIIGTVSLWSLAFKKGTKLRDLKVHFDLSFIALLICRPLSSWSFVLAFKYGSLAVTNYVSGMSVPLIVVLGIFVLGEKDRLREKMTALIVALAGLTLILVSKL